MHCLYGGYNLHRFSDALGLVSFVISIQSHIYPCSKALQNVHRWFLQEMFRVRNLKFTTSKPLVNSMKKVRFCLKLGGFQF